MCVVIYTDGAVSGNGKEKSFGGWGWFCEKTGDREWGSIITGATNQICELTAVIEACKYADFFGRNQNTFPPVQYEIRSDSAYIINCYNDKWYCNWQRNGWKNSKKEDVANRELWEELIPYFENPCFNFVKVKGHSGEMGNEIADSLACTGRDYAKEVYGNNE